MCAFTAVLLHRCFRDRRDLGKIAVVNELKFMTFSERLNGNAEGADRRCLLNSTATRDATESAANWNSPPNKSLLYMCEHDDDAFTGFSPFPYPDIHRPTWATSGIMDSPRKRTLFRPHVYMGVARKSINIIQSIDFLKKVHWIKKLSREQILMRKKSIFI